VEATATAELALELEASPQQTVRDGCAAGRIVALHSA